MNIIKEIEKEYNLFKKEVYPPSVRMVALQDFMIHKFFDERIPYLLSRIREIEGCLEKIYEYSCPGDTPEIDKILHEFMDKEKKDEED
jgi:hypothetical protein